MTTRAARISALCLCLVIVGAPLAHAMWEPDGVDIVPVPETGNASSQQIATDGSGGAIITWMDDRSGNLDIYAQRVNASGQVQWETNGVAICTAGGDQSSPQITPDGPGGAIITWQDTRSGNLDIYAQRVNADGQVQWAVNGVAICTVGGDQQSPQIAPDASGGAIITWEDCRGGPYPDIYAQRVNASGQVLWAANGVATCTAGGDQVCPRITPAGSGGAIITWEDSRSGYNDIYAQRVNADGQIPPSWLVNGVAVCTARNDQLYPQITTDGSEGAIITWQDRRGAGGIPDIYAQRVNASGLPVWGTNGVAICAAGGDQASPRIATDGSGGAIITWQDYRSGNYDIYAQRVNADGQIPPSWLTNGVAICTAEGDQTSPEITRDGWGGAIITWQDDRSGNYDIYAQRVNADGQIPGPWTANGVAICMAEGSQQYPQVTTDGSEGAIITWQDYRSGNYDIYAQRVNASGQSQWSLNGVAMCAPEGYQTHPQITPDGSGGAIITWRDGRRGVVNQDIYAQRVDASGQLQWAEDGVSMCAAAGTQGSPQITPDGTEGAIITWEDDRNGLTDIYAQRVDAYGQVQWEVNGVAVSGDPLRRHSPQITPDGSRGAIITWEEGGIDQLNICAQRVSASGQRRWGVNGVAVCMAMYDQTSPEIASDGSEGAIIAWEDDRSGFTDIYAQRVDAYGQVQWEDQWEEWNGVPICTAGGGQYGPQITPDGSGGAIITWEDNRNGTPGIYAQRVNADGHVQWEVNGVAICTAGHGQVLPQIAPDGSEGAIITWGDYRNWYPNGDIYAQRVNASGQVRWAVNGVAVCTAGGEQASPQITPDPLGGAIIAWVDGRSGSADIYAQRVNAYGQVRWETNGIGICTAANDQASPQVTTDGSGVAIITWEDNRNAHAEIYAQQTFTTGACCHPDGSCSEISQDQCPPPSVWHGVDSSCDPSPCPVCEVSPQSLDFGSVLVGSFADRSFDIQNMGAGVLAGEVSEACANYSIVSGGEPYSLGPGASVTVTVRFTPPGAGPYSCTIETGNEGCGDVACTGSGQGVFSAIGAGLPEVRDCAVSWGDYDNDRDLDVALMGDTGSGYITGVYRNDGGGVFADSSTALPGAFNGGLAWGDYDNDGDLDLALTGNTGSGYISCVYRNDGPRVFTLIDAGLTVVGASKVAWGDYDNDGDLDLVLTGNTGTYENPAPVTQVYRKDGGGVFTPVNVGLMAVFGGSVAWGDCDSDGDLDLLLTGSTGAVLSSRVYRNDRGVFVPMAELPGVWASSGEWGDFDNDGGLDILLTGYNDTLEQVITRVYRNAGGGVFTDISAGLSGVCWGSAVWGDCDSDGDLDILLTGWEGSSGISRVYRNDGLIDGTWVFTDFNAGLSGVSHSAAAWGDYDNDERLDILLAGYTGSANITQIYRNNTLAANTPPAPPGDLAVSEVGDSLMFSWASATDDHTPSAGLTYNLRIGTTPGGSQVMPAMADSATGYRRVVQLGNTNHRRAWIVHNPGVTCYWSVQALDGSFAGSPFAAEQIVGPPFTDIDAGLTGVSWCSAAWGDYDSDADLDLALTGGTDTGTTTRLYRNDAGTFVDIGAGLPEVWGGVVAWGDYDNDGDLDLLLTGDTQSRYLSCVYHNDGHDSFSDIGAGLPGVIGNPSAWGDYDNDGDLDILLCGWDGSAHISRVYRNDGGSFHDIGAGLVGVSSGWTYQAWGDYDNDGDLDLILTGGSDPGTTSRIYRNNAGTFFDIGAGLPGVGYCSAAWGDYDHDGDLDLLLAGETGSEYLTRVYRNDNGIFTDIAAGLPGTSHSAVAWGDYDHDGNLDIALTGYVVGGARISSVYRNAGGSFVDALVGLPGVMAGGVAWGDYNNDGRLDLLLAGHTAQGVSIARIYQNNTPSANTPPAPPGDLAVYEFGDSLMFSWASATDDHTPSAGLTYNLRIGTTPGGSQVMPAMADSATGYRRVVQLGNTNHRRAWMVHNPGVTCYWSVQALDGSFAGSAFAPEELLEASGIGGDAQVWETALLRVVPNPTSSGVSVYFALAEDGPTHLEVFDPAGRTVWSWQDAAAGKGLHVVGWDGRDDSGWQVGSGTYYLRVVTPQRSWSRPILLLR